MYEVPVPRLDPPEEAAYQLIVPLEAPAESVKVPFPQREAGVELEILGIAFIVATTAVREVEVQLPKVASA